MSGSGNSPSVSSSSKERSADEASTLANRLILAQIQTKLKKNPTTYVNAKGPFQWKKAAIQRGPRKALKSLN
ncbi:hypothetical protein E5D57_013483 [Metarhizium anisopliae]|nr:hypothetical protein E5D57_013483 [Metarhizium anisopliae]